MCVLVCSGCPHMYCVPVYALSLFFSLSFWIPNLPALQTAGFSWCVGNLFDWEHFQLLKQDRSEQINTLSFPWHNNGDIFQRAQCKTVCVCVCVSFICVFICLWLTGRATLHFICLVCQLLLPMGAGLVEGSEMCFSHVHTSKRFAQSPAPRGHHWSPQTLVVRDLYICHFGLIYLTVISRA